MNNRNKDKFPGDFPFQLTQDEAGGLRGLRSQFVTLNTGRGRHRKYLPYAFTEHGALMASTVLNSPRAVVMSIYIIRAFVKMHEDFLRKSTRPTALKPHSSAAWN